MMPDRRPGIHDHGRMVNARPGLLLGSWLPHGSIQDALPTPAAGTHAPLRRRRCSAT